MKFSGPHITCCELHYCHPHVPLIMTRMRWAGPIDEKRVLGAAGNTWLSRPMPIPGLYKLGLCFWVYVGLAQQAWNNLVIRQGSISLVRTLEILRAQAQSWPLESWAFFWVCVGWAQNPKFYVHTLPRLQPRCQWKLNPALL